MTFSEPDQPAEPDIPREQLDALLEKGSRLEDEARKIGLYAQNIHVGTAVDPHSQQPGDPVLIATFLIGDVAFSNRVQNPEQAAVNDEFAKMESEIVNDPSATIHGLESLRDRLSKKDDADDGSEAD